MTEKDTNSVIELLQMAICPNCDGNGIIQTQSRQYVTREMALDCGCPDMEGSVFNDNEYDQCQWCDERRMLINKYKI